MEERGVGITLTELGNPGFDLAKTPFPQSEGYHIYQEDLSLALRENGYRGILEISECPLF